MFARHFALAAVLSAGLSAAAAAQPAAVTIALWSYNFAPKPIYLRAGAPVTLTFVNRANKSHDFTARAFVATSRIIAGAAPGGEIELRGGQSRTITLIPRAGTYQAHCSHFLHTQFGMTDTIIVN